MSDDHARVRCYADDKARINDLRTGDDTQADVIRRLLNHPLADADDRTLQRFEDARERTGDDVPKMPPTAFLSALLDTQEKVKRDGYGDKTALTPVGDGEPAEWLDEALADAGSGLTFDDVKAACAAAIRDELPVEDMGR